MLKNAIKALALAALGIIIYVAIRFEWRMGLGAIVSLLHDVFFIVAIFSMLRLEVDITFIAAVLTIVGYSINDTIVTFDRIRENIDRAGNITTKEELALIVNKSLRQTMGRSVNTVLTVIVVVVALNFLRCSFNSKLLNCLINWFSNRYVFINLYRSTSLVHVKSS